MRAIRFQTLLAVDHLHSRDMIHRRVKASSLRFDPSCGRIKLCCFDSARPMLGTTGGGADKRCLTLELQ